MGRRWWTGINTYQCIPAYRQWNGATDATPHGWSHPGNKTRIADKRLHFNISATHVYTVHLENPGMFMHAGSNTRILLSFRFQEKHTHLWCKMTGKNSCINRYQGWAFADHSASTFSYNLSYHATVIYVVFKVRSHELIPNAGVIYVKPSCYDCSLFQEKMLLPDQNLNTADIDLHMAVKKYNMFSKFFSLVYSTNMSDSKKCSHRRRPSERYSLSSLCIKLLIIASKMSISSSERPFAWSCAAFGMTSIYLGQ